MTVARYRCRICGRTFENEWQTVKQWDGLCDRTWEPSTFTRVRWWHGTPPNAEVHSWYLAYRHGGSQQKGSDLWWHNIHKHAVCLEHSKVGREVAYYRSQPEEIRKLLWV